jgi:hypothetical protein
LLRKVTIKSFLHFSARTQVLSRGILALSEGRLDLRIRVETSLYSRGKSKELVTC